jgi:hypothetical protein
MKSVLLRSEVACTKSFYFSMPGSKPLFSKLPSFGRIKRQVGYGSEGVVR